MDSLIVVGMLYWIKSALEEHSSTGRPIDAVDPEHALRLSLPSTLALDWQPWRQPN
jgi:hypothetical protein